VVSTFFRHREVVAGRSPRGGRGLSSGTPIAPFFKRRLPEVVGLAALDLEEERTAMRNRHHQAVLLSFLALGVTARAAEPDGVISLRVKIALLTAPGVQASDVRVEARAGAVVVRGRVGSEGEKSKAESVARKVEGVRTIEDLLQVVPASATHGALLSDADLRDKVDAALATDLALKTTDVKVKSVDGGVVLLGGAAETLDLELEAIERVASVKGVVRVASEVLAPIFAD